MKLDLKILLNDQANMVMKRTKPCEQATPDNLRGGGGIVM